MSSHIIIFIAAALSLSSSQTYAVPDGYHYERPTGGLSAPNLNTGHLFGQLPTIAPLPPVPALPPLPTARPNTRTQVQTQVQTLVQVHPPPPQKSIASAYAPPRSSYLPPASINAPRSPTYQAVNVAARPPTAYLAPSVVAKQAQAQPAPLPQQPSGYGIDLRSNQPPTAPFPGSAPGYPTGTAPGYSAGTAPAYSTGTQAGAQPLRIPYGKQAVIHYPSTAPDSEFYFSNGRQLKQYAVVEIIDNDIEQMLQPQLSSPFFDSYRAHIGASGTGAIPMPAGVQIDSRSNALVMEQQLLAQQQRRPGTNDAIALGSGGLGFVRLPNGGVSLGSGSLGYISGQQRTQSILEARTRSGAPMPDPLHFGHGPLGDPDKRVFRFK